MSKCKHGKFRCSECAKFKMRIAFKNNINLSVNFNKGGSYQWMDYYNFNNQNNDNGRKALFNLYLRMADRVIQMELYDREINECIGIYVNGMKASEEILDKVNNKVAQC